MTTTEIYYDKGYQKGKQEARQDILQVMDKMNKIYKTKNHYMSKDWNDGYESYDDGR